jgi:hypothetical protein
VIENIDYKLNKETMKVVGEKNTIEIIMTKNLSNYGVN